MFVISKPINYHSLCWRCMPVDVGQCVRTLTFSDFAVGNLSKCRWLQNSIHFCSSDSGLSNSTVILKTGHFFTGFRATTSGVLLLPVLILQRCWRLFFFIGYLLLDKQNTLQNICFPSETFLEKTKFHLQVVVNWRWLLSWGQQHVSICPFLSRTPSAANQCRP